MKYKYKLGIIGFGFMSQSIVNGILKKKYVKANEIIVSDALSDKLLSAKSLKINTTEDNLYLTNNSEYVLFAVKPQSLSSVLDEINGTTANKFLSIMAGVKKDKIKSKINGAMVARSMPNTPCSIGKGAIGLDLSDYSEKKDIDFIKGLFDCFAVTVLLPEGKLNAVTGISGSSPAYFYYFIKSLVDSGVKNGLSYDDSLKLAVNTMIGSGEMILNNPEKQLDELIKAVCSKGGTTIEAIKVFDEEGLTKIVDKSVGACIKRAEELENL